MSLKPREKYNRILAVGRGIEGQLNNNCAINRSKPVFISGKIWTEIDIGDGSRAIDCDGNLWSWGQRQYAGIGNGTYIVYSSPIQIPGCWSKVSTNCYSTAAIKSNCTLWVWGNNTNGALGINDGTTICISTPVQVPGTWKCVSVGSTGMIGIRHNGDLYTWGKNQFGELGDNSIIYRSSPVFIGSDFIDASMSCTGTSAIKSNGELYAWGRYTHHNTYGPISNRSTPVIIPGNWICIKNGPDFSIALKDDCSLWAWGSNCYGRTGVGLSTENSCSPTQIPGSWCDISTKCYHSMGLKTNGSLWTWGSNTIGQIGKGDIEDYSYPVQILGKYKKISAGSSYSFAIEDCLYEKGKVYVTNRLSMVGSNSFGQLGNNSIVSSSSPIFIPTLFSQISVFCNFHGIKEDGTLWGWGRNNVGQITANNTTSPGISSPTQIPGIWKCVWSGYSAAFAKDNNDITWAWGHNAEGELGIGDIISRSSPVQLPGDWLCITPKILATSGIKSDCTLWTWGASCCGSLGHISNIPLSSPTQIPGSWLSGMLGCCNYGAGIKTDCTAWVWGHWLYTNVATGGYTPTSSPVQIPGRFIKLSVGSHTIKLIDTDCRLWAWGLGTCGDVGNNKTETNISTPVQIPGIWKDVSNNHRTTYAINENNDLWVWGENACGIFGIGNISPASSPIQIAGKYSCAITGINIGAMICSCSFEYNKEHNLKIASLNDLSLANKQGCWAEYVPEIDG